MNVFFVRQITFKYFASPATKKRAQANALAQRQRGAKHLKISKTVETPEGTIKFEGELNAE